jgi:hypothetical protein
LFTADAFQQIKNYKKTTKKVESGCATFVNKILIIVIRPYDAIAVCTGGMLVTLISNYQQEGSSFFFFFGKCDF